MARKTSRPARDGQQPAAPQGLDPDQAAAQPGQAETAAPLITQDESQKLIVVGASAGGIQALRTLVSALNPNIPAPVVLAQHLDPYRPSALPDILERGSALPIVTVNGPTRLEPGKVYVVAANRHIMIQDGHVSVDADHLLHPRPSVDLLFSSAAAAYGDRLIAVILTGSGSDGAFGAVEVKRGGGTVIIQNPQTVRFPSMPLALPPPWWTTWWK